MFTLKNNKGEIVQISASEIATRAANEDDFYFYPLSELHKWIAKFEITGNENDSIIPKEEFFND